MNIILPCSVVLLTISLGSLTAWAYQLIISNVILPKVYKQLKPKLKLEIFHYVYDIIDSRYIDFNITKLQSIGHIMYLNVFKENIDLYASTSIHFAGGKGNEYGTEFVNKTISVCRLIHDRRYEPFLRIMHAMLKEYSPEFINKCPIKKKLYYVRLVDFETDKIPPVWPEKQMQLIANYFSKEKNNFRQLFTFTMHIKVMKK